MASATPEKRVINSEKVSFPGGAGPGGASAQLAARLDRPDGEVVAYALFAHCFTCSKDIFAASRIASRLAERGIATLRFDFTGLGASDGDFAHTNFSSNVQDLKAAADMMAERFAAPQIIIGHSLGGAAVLAVAGDLPSVKAVVTIGAPSSVDHVLHNFGADLATIEAKGEATVSLGGRPFQIRKQFIDDARGQTLETKVANLRRPLLVMHAPLDSQVGIENATGLFVAAKHPKSFVSLDDADHLLTRKADAAYAADVIASWSARYLDGETAGAPAPALAPKAASSEAMAPVPEGVVRVAETSQGKFHQDVRVGSHLLSADEPASVGGTNLGPTPYEFLAAALGACTTMTLRMYADRKGLAMEHVSVDVTHSRIHLDDCEACVEDAGDRGRVDVFTRRITIVGPELTAEQRKRLIEIADKCPVHRTLEHKAHVETVDVS